MALINTTFHIGAMLAVQGTGLALPVLGWPGILSLLATGVLAVLGLVASQIAATRKKSLLTPFPR